MPIIGASSGNALSEAANRKRKTLNSAYEQMEAAYNEMQRFVWYNGGRHTPQQVFDAYDTDAADLCNLSSAYVDFVQKYKGKTLKPIPDGYSIARNTDGTVTVSGAPTAVAKPAPTTVAKAATPAMPKQPVIPAVDNSQSPKPAGQ